MDTRQEYTQTQQIADVACTLCGCVCDDLQFVIKDNRIQSMTNACEKAAAWYGQLETSDQFVRDSDHNESILEAKIAHAAALLRNARYPLIYGLSSSSTAGQRAAVALADRLGGVIDTSASTCHAPSIMAFQQVGESTSSLGEARQRADLVVFWGSNPLESHPRHLERYSNAPPGELLRSSDNRRTIVVVDTVESETSQIADLFVKLDPSSDLDVIWTLRALVKGLSVPHTEIGGVAFAQISALADLMMNCHYGAFFFGLGLARGPLAHLNVEALLRLATDLHQKTRIVVRRMRRYGDVAGADSVLCWQTGYPFSVDLARGYPRYQPGEFSAEGLLERQEPDCCVFVGTDSLTKLSNTALSWLQQIPTIVLTHGQEHIPFQPTVTIPVAMYGVHCAGTAYRMDEIPIPLRPMLSTELPTDEDVLNSMMTRIENAEK